MGELIRNAWLGWGNYITEGKLAALLLAAIFFLWMGRAQRGSGRSAALLLYSSAAAVCCMIPVTAAALMLYQTRFYDYEWVWSLTPATAVTALGAAEFLGERWDGFRRGIWKKGLPATLLLLAVLLLCGGPGRWTADGREQAGARGRAADLLEELRRRTGERELCLWAPREILEYARELDGGICLAYGRNMWDVSLNAYSYDVYGEPARELYRFMERDQEKAAEEELAAADRCAGLALGEGINCILLPPDMEAAVRERLESALGKESERLGEYYLIIL